VRSHDDPNLIHPHERVSPDPAVEKDDRMGARGAQRWRDAWNQKTPEDAAARERREDDARGAPPHCRCNIPATDHERIYRFCVDNAQSGTESQRRRTANDYLFAKTNGWRPDVPGWTPPPGSTIPGWTLTPLPADIDPDGLRVEIYHDGCGFNAKPLRTDVNRVVAAHMTSRHAG
jgi:hypothetical protein